jgi:hypothetical protein
MRAASTLAVDFPEPEFRPIDGNVEIRVAEAAESSASRPRRVTSIIAATCERLDRRDSDEERVRCVSAAGREWLLLQSALLFFKGTSWFEAPCGKCGGRFDLELPLADVPRGTAGKGFPEVEVQTSLGPRRFEAPNGHHEEAAVVRHAADHRRLFAKLCGLSDNAAEEGERFVEEDLVRVDSALGAISPEIADFVDAGCPDCKARVRVRIDPLSFAFPSSESVLRDVDAIASAYSWSESAILALPSERRLAYAALIDAGRGRRPARGRVQ